MSSNMQHWSVQMVISGLSEVVIAQQKVSWRFAMTVHGVEYVVTSGTGLQPRWLAESWDFHQQVIATPRFDCDFV